MNLSSHPPAATIPNSRKRGSRILIVLFLAAVAVMAAVVDPGVAPEVPFQAQNIGALSQSAWEVALSKVGESPAVEAQPWQGDIIFCDQPSDSQRRAFADGVALMRATSTGTRLFQMLQDEGVCIGVEELDYNSAYATARWSPVNGWANSEVRVDSEYVTFLYPDVLAAILIHEATHIDRALTRTACYYADACTVLPNGVYLEEEVVAHSAEAEFWIALYGRDGKDRALANDHAQNQLKAYFLQGPEAFRTFVEEMRSDAREGEGIA